MSRPCHELSEIISLYGADYEQKNQPTEQQRSVLSKLSECRTSPLGGHVDTWDGCGTIRISYNSCRNRHCPKYLGAQSGHSAVHQEIEPEHQPEKELIRKLNAHKWVVYAKQPFFGPKQVIEYLGRYTHKVAISNHRIKSVEDGLVTFSWKDYHHGDVQKLMTLEAPEFLRRFCLHVLPFRFVKIRHYGILSSRNKLKLRDVQFGMGIVVEKKPKPTWQQVCRQKLNFDPLYCLNLTKTDTNNQIANKIPYFQVCKSDNLPVVGCVKQGFKKNAISVTN